MIIALLLAQAVTSADLRPSGFYVAGIQQGMSLTEYTGMIANGGYKSKPIGPDHYWASIEGRDLFVTFCRGHTVEVLATYDSATWLRSLQALATIGFHWTSPAVSTANDKLNSGIMVFGITVPKGYTYGVTPMIKGMAINGREAGSFQLNFMALDNPCRATS